MIEVDNDILEFKLHGNGVSPKTFRSKEVALLLVSLEDAIKAYIIENISEDEDFEESDLFISPVSIRNESMTLGYIPNVKKYIIPAFSAIAFAINSNDLTSLPQRSIENLKEIQKITRQKNCQADFKLNGTTIAQIDAETQISIPDSYKIKGDTILYGKVIRVGGANPVVRIKLDNNITLSLGISQNDAIRLAHKLYKEVGFRGTASWAKDSYRLIDFNVKSIIDEYEPTGIKESFEELSLIAGKYWDDIENIEEYLLRD